MTLKEFFADDHFAAAAGVEIMEIRRGYAKCSMPVTKVVTNASGWVQGGALFTLADLAFAAALNTHDALTVSVNSSIAFFKSARDGMLYAEAHELVDHKKLPYGEVRITNEEGELIALFTSSGYRKHAAIEYDGYE